MITVRRIAFWANGHFLHALQIELNRLCWPWNGKNHGICFAATAADNIFVDGKLLIMPESSHCDFGFC
jgi:hypothetical protein